MIAASSFSKNPNSQKFEINLYFRQLIADHPWDLARGEKYQSVLTYQSQGVLLTSSGECLLSFPGYLSLGLITGVEFDGFGKVFKNYGYSSVIKHPKGCSKPLCPSVGKWVSNKIFCKQICICGCVEIEKVKRENSDKYEGFLWSRCRDRAL